MKIIVVILIFTAVVSAVGPKLLYMYTNYKGESLKNSLVRSDASKTGLAISEWASLNWHHPGTGSKGFNFNWASNSNPFDILTREEVLYLNSEGWCNELVSVVKWIFRNDSNVNINQINLVGKNTAHSAIELVMNDKAVYIDPYFGFVFQENGVLLSMQEIINALDSHSIEKIALRLPGKNNDSYPLDLKNLRGYAREGELMELAFSIAVPFSAGQADGQSSMQEFVESGLSTMFDFIGARYYPEMKVTHNIETTDGAKITFTLRDSLDDPILPISNIAPIVNGNTLTYVLEPGQASLILDYRNFPDGVYHRVDKYEVTPL